MKISNSGCIDSGYGKAGFTSFKKGYTWEEAERRWQASGKNSLWIKGALRSFKSAGGDVPSERFKKSRNR